MLVITHSYLTTWLLSQKQITKIFQWTDSINWTLTRLMPKLRPIVHMQMRGNNASSSILVTTCSAF